MRADAGGCPAATHFLLLRQKKSNQRKGDPTSGSFRCATGNLRCSIPPAGKTTRLWLKQVFPLDAVSISAPRPSLHGVGEQIRIGFGEPQARSACGESSDFVFVFLPPNPWRGAEKHRARRIRAETCLSRRRVVSDPGWTEHRRVPRRGRRTGSPFFSLGFFGEAKKSNSPAGATPGLVVKGTTAYSAQTTRGQP